MSIFSKLFGPSAAPAVAASLAALQVDMHSHVLPGLDDGAETLEHSLDLLRQLQAFGYRKLIMTPHIMGDFYRNTPEGIRGALEALKTAAARAGITGLELDCAAEYYLDESFGRRLEQREPLLTFGGARRLVLFETSYINEPFNLNESIFNLQAAGYQPVLAHPERYTYLYGRFEELERLREQGVMLQVNLNSLSGYYSAGAKRVAEKLIDGGLVDLLGSDTHHVKHLATLRTKTLLSPYLAKALALPLLNNTL
ncbi:tyrosine-protein phosphatase [Hymenobacter actinosclerus]|uniref:protein-tyrosine-phosphatase n=1 Tax=Hymenobacter actinosclerus TaxID=82805 RepID=A0A1H9ZSJ0_9BACT|nr:CpsB/CapC family capsule biosynthesis tyrosine phosphatase [Hymenobacter actinosclerus]SES84673.1 Tyrosine-protein phosphatase YwqE [Hymenobacter actinosclerus]